METNTNLISDALSLGATVPNHSSALPSMYIAVGAASALATFVASVIAADQDARLRNGTFGAVAGSAIGGMAALLKGQQELLIVGFLGSGIGAFLGWISTLILSAAFSRPNGRSWLEYYVGGFAAIRQRLDFDDKRTLLVAVSKWRLSFAKMIDNQKHEILLRPKGAETDVLIKLAINTWLGSGIEFLGLMFETLAKKPEYRSRSALFIFGKQATDQRVAGKLWLSHIGSLHSYKPMDLNETSIGYKVLRGEIESPHFSTNEEAKKSGQNRGRAKYRPFYTYKVHPSAILVIDWPDDPDEHDEYVAVAIDIFKRDIGPAVEALLNHWSGQLPHVVALQPL